MRPEPDAAAGDAHGEKIEAEEKRGDDAVEVAVEMLRRQAIAGADQARGADEAEEQSARRPRGRRARR